MQGACFVKNNDKHVIKSHLLVAKNVRNVMRKAAGFCCTDEQREKYY